MVQARQTLLVKSKFLQLLREQVMWHFSKIRQFKFPKEFRIPPPTQPKDIISLIEVLNDQIQNLKQVDIKDINPNDKEMNQFLADLATGLWRLKQKMIKSGTNQPLESMNRAYRHLESIWDTVVQVGVDIKDHTGDLFDSGMSIKVLAFQPTEGLSREKIIETIKPSVYLKNKRIQMGEVIVGTPENKNNY
ncbi:hypothetical protein ACX8XP_12980 [Calditrichota bacterium LG25]